MSGFSIGDVFGKTFLSAETIIGGRSTKKVFNAPVSNVQGLGTNVTLADLIMYYQKTAGTTAQQDGAKRAIAGLKVKQNNSNITVSNITSGTGRNLFRFGSNDTIVLDKKGKNGATGDQAFHIKPASGYTMKFRLKAYDPSYLSSKSDRPKNSANKDLADASGMTNGGYNNISGYSKDSAGEMIEVTLNGDDGDYISVDMGEGGGKNNSGIAAFRVVVKGAGTFTGKEPRDHMNTVAITFRGLSKNPVKGCTDTSASNYDSNATSDNGSCAYSLATIKSFTRSPTGTVKPGDMVKFSYALNSLGNLPSRKGFSKVELLLDGNVIKDFGRSVSNDDTIAIPKEGNLNYEIRVSWDKVSATKTESLSVNSVAPQSLVACEDPNASKYGETSATGNCGPCNSGYSRDSSGGVCKKEGCTTDGDYNFDPDAEIHKESMCGGTPETGGDNGGTDGTGDGNGETGGTGGTGGTDGTGGTGGDQPQTDETGDAISSQIEPEEADLSKWILPGIGVLAIGAIILMR